MNSHGKSKDSHKKSPVAEPGLFKDCISLILLDLDNTSGVRFCLCLNDHIVHAISQGRYIERLVITTAQYRIPAAPNVVEISMPLAGAAQPLAGNVPEGPGTLLVGGPAFPDQLDAAVAATLASDAMAYANGKNKILSVQTSPRTPDRAIAALARSIAPRHRLAIFGLGENRYSEALAEASELVVTSDSVSMLSDALVSGKPVSVYPLPQSRNIKWQIGEWLYRNAIEEPSLPFAPVRWLFDTGLMEAAADRRRLLARLVAGKRLTWFGDGLLPPQPEAMQADLETAVRSLRGLVGQQPGL